jgi:hypothetical protein
VGLGDPICESELCMYRRSLKYERKAILAGQLFWLAQALLSLKVNHTFVILD